MSSPVFWGYFQILMNVLLWWVYVEMDVASIALEGSVVIVSQVTPLPRIKPDAEVRSVWITCDWTVFHVSMHVLKMFHLYWTSLVSRILKSTLSVCASFICSKCCFVCLERGWHDLLTGSQKRFLTTDMTSFLNQWKKGTSARAIYLLWFLRLPD